MASLHPKVAKTQNDSEKVEEEEKGRQKKQRNRWNQAQDDKKKAKTKLMNLLIKNKTKEWDQDLWNETPSLERLAVSDATTAMGKRQPNMITVKSKDIDNGGTTKSKGDVDSEPFKTDGLEYDERLIREHFILISPLEAERSALQEDGTKNEWFKMQTFDPRGKGLGVVDGGGGGGGGRGGIGNSGLF